MLGIFYPSVYMGTPKIVFLKIYIARVMLNGKIWNKMRL